ncbi:MAG: hypothetical protein M3Z85_07315, partial [Acidobacteriota bacterium]|nr:hypothetical protein [Acidobacteriota bacterium]
MKITKSIAAAVLSATLVFALGHGPHGQGGTPPDPQTMIRNRVDRLATLLTLTDAQKAQAATIFTNAFS